MTPPRGNQRRRLDPVERRLEILTAARRLFAERGYPNVSTADLAAEAGVTRALVHHYFGSARGAYIEIGLEMVRALTGTLPAGDNVALPTRVSRNMDAFLDVVGANRDLWTATVSRAWSSDDEDVSGLISTALEATAERLLGGDPAEAADPAAKLALQTYVGLLVFGSDLWLAGDATREATHVLLTSTLVDLVRRTIPKLQALES